MTDEQHRRMEEELAKPAAWDRRYDPPEPQWTSDTPTVSGYYWWRQNAGYEPQAVAFEPADESHGHPAAVSRPWHAYRLTPGQMSGQWCGPITPPSEVWETADERVVQWNKEQTAHLRERLRRGTPMNDDELPEKCFAFYPAILPTIEPRLDPETGLWTLGHTSWIHTFATLPEAYEFQAKREARYDGWPRVYRYLIRHDSKETGRPITLSRRFLNKSRQQAEEFGRVSVADLERDGYTGAMYAIEELILWPDETDPWHPHYQPGE